MFYEQKFPYCFQLQIYGNGALLWGYIAVPHLCMSVLPLVSLISHCSLLWYGCALFTNNDY
jgi:hypothetical protein